MQHRIRKQVMDLTIRGRLDAFRAQHLAGPFYNRQLLPVLEKIFDELSEAGRIDSVDRLELDLGIIPIQEWDGSVRNGSWETLLREQVTKALREQRKNVNMKREAINQGICGQWLFYMKNGFLNWNTNGFDEKAMAAVLETLATDFAMVLELRQLIKKNQNALQRIARNHSEQFLVSLSKILTTTPQHDLLPAVDEIERLFEKVKHQPTPSGKQLRNYLWLKIIQTVAAEKPGLPTGMLIKKILLSEQNLPSFTQRQLKELSELKTIYPVLKVLQVKQQVRDKKQRFETEAESNPTEQKPQEQSIEQSDEIDADGIYISNAGIVVLHPFFSPLFKKLGLVADGKFINAPAMEKGLHLLHYLATGNTSGEEHELVIPKLLCAVPLHYALKERIELSTDEKLKADNMLSAAIENWEKLKNVSIEALRENFLQRSGKLYTKNDMRFLQVENGSLDVLLDFLPWTLSMVKLPWMKEILRIEWR